MISRLSRSIEGDHEQQLPFGLPAAVGELTCGREDQWIPRIFSNGQSQTCELLLQ